MESLPNSKERAYTAVTCCYAGMHKETTVFQRYSGSNFEKSRIFQTDTGLGVWALIRLTFYLV